MYFCVVICVWCCLRDTFEIISRITNHLPIFCKHCWNSHSSAFGCGLTSTYERKASILNEAGQGDLAVFDERKQANNQLQHGMKSLKALCFACFRWDFLTRSGFSKLTMAAWLEKMEGLFNWKQCDYRNLRSLNNGGCFLAHFKGRILGGWLIDLCLQKLAGRSVLLATCPMSMGLPF